jgi:hypothetical protein
VVNRRDVTELLGEFVALDHHVVRHWVNLSLRRLPPRILFAAHIRW